MPASYSRPGARALALALAAGTLCATAGVTATAATAATGDTTKDARTSSTAGTALHIAVNLPVGGNLVEDISIVNGQIKRTESTGAVGTASLLSGSGTLSGLLNGLNKEISVALDGIRTATAALVPQANVAGLVSVAAGTVNGVIAPLTGLPAVKNPLSTNTSSKVTDLNVGLGLTGTTSGGALTGVLDKLQTTINGLIGSTGGAGGPGGGGILSSVTGLLNGSNGTVAVPAGGPLAGLLGRLPTQLTALQTSLTDLTGPGGLAHIGLIGAVQKILDDGTAVAADATSNVGDVKLLGSLVGVNALQSTALATTNGKPGGAKATLAPKGSIADVNVGSLVDLQATITGLTGQLGGLAAPLQTTLKTLLDQLNGLLSTLGVTVGDLDTGFGPKTSCDGTTPGTFAAKDGSCAEAITRGIGIRLAPLGLGAPTSAGKSAAGAAAPLLEIALVPAAASSRGSQVVTPGLNPPPAAPNLPRTGGTAALTAGLGGLLLAGAAFAWRRRRTLSD